MTDLSGVLPDKEAVAGFSPIADPAPLGEKQQTSAKQVFNRSKLLCRRQARFCLDSAHGVFQLGHIKQPFSAEPWGILPTETLAEGVVWSNDIPVAINIRSIDGALRPIGLPLGDLHPHDSCKDH